GEPVNSFQNGTNVAPGTWPSSNSCCERTSRIVGAAPASIKSIRSCAVIWDEGSADGIWLLLNDEAARLHLEPRQRTWRRRLDGHGQPQRPPKRGFYGRAHGRRVPAAGCEFDLDGELAQRRRRRDCGTVLRNLNEAPHHVFDGRRVDVYPANDG